MAITDDTFTLLRRLRRDKRGNTIAIMAAALVPMLGFAGSAVDMSRLYVVKARLQQACDAGVLAGRKFMTTSASTTLDSAAATQATSFFNNNFASGWMGTTDVSFTPSKSGDGQVAGVATATVPMTVMRFFGATTSALNVTCEARYDVSDADIMFVLDTTGSMADTPSGSGNTGVRSYSRPDGTTGYSVGEASGSKISGLRAAVLNFYDTLATNADPTTNIRYGFVTYTSTVNAGRAITGIDSSYMASKWTYPTRRVVGDRILKTNSSTEVAAADAAACAANYSRNPATYAATDPNGAAYTVYPFDTGGRASAVDPVYAKSGNVWKCTLNNDTITPIWRYAHYTYDVSQFVAGNTVVDPSKISGATTTWNGCIEERSTTAGASSFDVNNLPPDLDPDLVPTSAATRWRPMWQDVIYYRGNNTSVDSAGTSTNPYGDYTGSTQYAASSPLTLYNNIAYGYVSCGKPVQRLQVMQRSDVANYVNAADFVPQGGTYHDTGMIWGTRLISPNGIFKNDTSAWPGRNTPNRYIVFMTDGDMAPNQQIYGMYGLEYYDKRVANGDTGNLTAYHNSRFLAECAAAKARNIKVFVVGFGQTLTTQLTQCASPGAAYYASDNASLTTAFANIAKQVAMLRVSK